MKTIYAYTHTHWDREWYQPFETFRIHLVSVLRQIINDLEAGKLNRFYLDGQAIIIEDALEIAPELGPRISALMQQGELAAGPWYVLPDEMLVCGESLIRNLKTGIALVRRFGAPSLVGYSPDTFGHTQDLPRILSGFGITSAFLWRGVPPLSYGPCFWWKSPDGSQVLSYHLSRGYYQTSLIEKTQAGISNAALDEYVDELTLFANDRSQWENPELQIKTPDALLYAIGGDHTAPPRNLTETIRQLNEKLNANGLRLAGVQLSEFATLLEEQAKTAHKIVGVVAKELRENCASQQYANAYLLPGVLSTRLYLKRENREAERRLFRFAEPLFSLLAIRGLNEYPQAELAHALRLLLKNHPHDSICGCSVDAVHDEMLIRFAGVHQIIEPLIEDAKIKLSCLADDSAKSCQDPDAELKRLRLINPHGRSFTGAVPFAYFVRPDEIEDSKNTNIQITQSENCDQLFAGWGRVPYYKVVDRKQGYIWVEDLPAYGELNLSWPPAKAESSYAPVDLKENTLDNGILKVSAHERGELVVVWTRADKTQTTYELKHLLRDIGDGGDTYNFDPVPGDKPVYAKFVTAQPGMTGPLVSSILLKYEIQIPESLIEDKRPNSIKDSEPKIPLFKRSAKNISHELVTEVIIRRGSRILEFETCFTNQASGHRLEALLATGNLVNCSYSENHFSLVRRYHQTTDIHTTSLPVAPGCEAPCDRFPTQRFIISNGQLILNKGLPEYGAEADAITLTLLRSVSLLSRGRMQSRGGGAGPHIAVPGAECKGPNKTSYAWSPLSVFQNKEILFDILDEDIVVEAYDLAEAYEQEIFAAFSSSDSTEVKSLLHCDSQKIRFVSTYVSDDKESVFVRLQNVCNEIVATKVFAEFDFQSAHLCRLDEETGEEVFIYREYVTTDYGSASQHEACALAINFSSNELKTIKFSLRSVKTEMAPAASRSRKKRTSSATA